MSSAPDPNGHDAHDAFTGEPVQVLPPDEPRTPGWLPLLGVAFFTAAAVIFLAGKGSEPAGEAKPEQAPPALAVPAPLQPALAQHGQAQPGQPRPPAEAIRAQPTPAGGTAVPMIKPDQLEQMRRALDTSKARGAAKGH